MFHAHLMVDHGSTSLKPVTKNPAFCSASILQSQQINSQSSVSSYNLRGRTSVCKLGSVPQIVFSFIPSERKIRVNLKLYNRIYMSMGAIGKMASPISGWPRLTS